MAAISAKEFLEAQQRYIQAQQKPESISVKELKGLLTEGPKETSGRSKQSETVVLNKISTEIKKQSSIIEKTSAKIIQELKRTGDILSSMAKATNRQQAIQPTREDQAESARAESRQLALLERIEENTRGLERQKAEPIKEDKKPGGLDLPLGGAASALAITIGAAIAAFKSQIKTIQLFAKTLLPESLLNALRKKTTSFLAGISMQYDLAKQAIIDNFAAARKIVESMVDSVKAFFSDDGAIVSTVRKVYGVIKNVFTSLAEPFVELYSYIKKASKVTEIFSPITNAIESITSWGSKFGALVSKSAKRLLKIFYPLNVIMTLWDTVKGAIEGFEKDGFIGGLAGAIKGFFNSLVFGFVDLIKDAASWVLGALGFDKAEKFLDSFSFQELFSDFIDAVFSPIETIKKIFNAAVNFLQEIEIPKIGFTIPVINKEVSIGPFKPFAEQKETPAALPQQTQSASTQTTVEDIKPVSSNIEQAIPVSQATSPIAEEVATALDKVIPEAPLLERQIEQSAANISPITTDTLRDGQTIPTVASAVYQQSAEVQAAQTTAASSAPVIVNAPQSNTVNQTSQVALRSPTRNTDSSYQQYNMSKFAF